MNENITFDNLPAAIGRIEAQVSQLRAEIKGLKQTPLEDDLLDVKEAAKYLNLAVATIYIKASKREIPHLKQGKKLRFLKSDLLEWVKAGRKATTKEIEANGEDFLATKKGGKS